MGKSAVKKMFVRISQRMENFRLRNVHCCHTPPLQSKFEMTCVLVDAGALSFTLKILNCT